MRPLKDDSADIPLDWLLPKGRTGKVLPATKFYFGGGGGGTDATPPPTPPPSIHVARDKSRAILKKRSRGFASTILTGLAQNTKETLG